MVATRATSTDVNARSRGPEGGASSGEEVSSTGVASCHRSCALQWVPDVESAVRTGTLWAMSEADWWLCARCSSLNNLAARKCYSCRLRKPKDAVRASQHLGYVPVTSWDGKVTFEQVRHALPDAPGGTARPPTPAEPATPATPAAPTLPPLRLPEPRHILAVAPQPPNPARITYQDEAPPPGPPPLVAVGPGEPAQPQTDVTPWPHWQELLDGPVPHAERLRETVDEEAGGALLPRGGVPTSHSSEDLWTAIRQARAGDSSSRSFIPWPTTDRAQPEEDRPSEALRSLSPAKHPAE